MLEPAQGKKEFFFPFYFLFGHIINNLLTELGRSVWENLDLDRLYRPHCVRSVLATSVKILPYRPPARLIRTKYNSAWQKNCFSSTGCGTLDSTPTSCPGASSDQGHCVNSVLGQDTLLSQCLSPPRSINGYWRTVR